MTDGNCSDVLLCREKAREASDFSSGGGHGSARSRSPRCLWSQHQRPGHTVAPPWTTLLPGCRRRALPCWLSRTGKSLSAQDQQRPFLSRPRARSRPFNAYAFKIELSTHCRSAPPASAPLSICTATLFSASGARARSSLCPSECLAQPR